MAKKDSSKHSLHDLLRKIRIIFLDVDGVLTDGSIILLPDGDEQKVFDVKDGTGLVWAEWVGIKVALITGRRSRALEARASELRLSYLRQGVTDKVAAASEILADCAFGFESAAAMGDDYGDMALLGRAALPTCPSDAHPDILRIARWRSRCPGGHGAVRDLVEKIVRAQGLMQRVRERYDISPVKRGGSRGRNRQ